MDLSLLLLLVALAASAHGVPPSGPKFVPVFVSSDALSRLNENENGNQANVELGQEINPQGSTPQNGDYDLKKEIQGIFNKPAPVHESQPEPDTHHNHPHYEVNHPGQIQQPYQQLIQTQQPSQSQQPGQSYQIIQQPGQIQQPYQIIQQPGHIQQPYQIVQQPGQIQQSYQPQPGLIQQPILLAQQTGLPNPQPVYANQQQLLAGQLPLQANQQSVLSHQQPILVNQQQLTTNQPMQTYQQPNQQPILIGSQPIGNQQTIMTQPNGQQILISQPNQQPLLLQQSNQNGLPTVISGSNAANPINLGQPNVPNQGYPQSNGNVYAVVPLNNQNLAPNQNTNTYLVPVHQLPNPVYTVNGGK